MTNTPTPTPTPTAGDLVTLPLPPHTVEDGLHALRGIASQLGSEGDTDSEKCIGECCDIIVEALAASPALPAQSGAALRRALENLAISANRVWFKYGSETDWSEWLQVKADVNAAQAALSSPALEGEALTEARRNDLLRIVHANTRLIGGEIRTSVELPDLIAGFFAASAPEGEAAQGVEPTEAEIDRWAHSFANWRQGQSSTPRCEAPTKFDVEIARGLVVGVLKSRPAALAPPSVKQEEAGRG